MNTKTTNYTNKLALFGLSMIFFSLQAQAQIGEIGFNEADGLNDTSGFIAAMSLISNIVLAISAVIGVCLTTFALIGASMDGRWDEAKSKIGAGFALIIVPVGLKAVWLGVNTATGSGF
jgi:hypothetical protein